VSSLYLGFVITLIDISYLILNMMFSSQHAMVIDTRNSTILPRKGALLKINQVCLLSL